MKQLLLILSVFAFTVSLLPSCTLKSEYAEDMELPASVALSVGETYDFGAESSSWSSNNDFIASISKDGIVTAKHTGECKIKYSNFFQTLICKVTVSPNVTLYDEPILQWGMSKSKLISIEGTDYKVSGNTLGYMINSSTIPLKVYAFENEKLYSSVVVVKISSSERLADHLIDRYQPIVVEGTSNLFIDAYSQEEATTVVYMKLYTTEYWAVMYMDIDYFDSMSITKSKVPENLFEDIISSLDFSACSR